MTKNIYKSHLILIFVLLFTTILSACTSIPSKIIPTSTLPDINSMLPQDPEPGKEIDVFLYVTNVSYNDGRIEIIFNTNLPDDMPLFAFLMENGVNKYNNNGDMVVKYGTTKAVFNYTEKGNYEIYVGSLIYSMQPKSVQNIVGEDFRNLTGKTMKFGGMGWGLEYIEKVEVK